jgi:hypothetical protein
MKRKNFTDCSKMTPLQYAIHEAHKAMDNMERIKRHNLEELEKATGGRNIIIKIK